jgi:hypothetical protein
VQVLGGIDLQQRNYLEWGQCWTWRFVQERAWGWWCGVGVCKRSYLLENLRVREMVVWVPIATLPHSCYQHPHNLLWFAATDVPMFPCCLTDSVQPAPAAPWWSWEFDDIGAKLGIWLTCSESTPEILSFECHDLLQPPSKSQPTYPSATYSPIDAWFLHFKYLNLN